MTFTVVFLPCLEGDCTAFVKELPGANTHGELWNVARANPAEALETVLEANRSPALESLEAARYLTEPLIFAAA